MKNYALLLILISWNFAELLSANEDKKDGLLTDSQKVQIPKSESLVASPTESEDQNQIDGNPEPPFWIKPEVMGRQVFAKPLSSTVRIKSKPSKSRLHYRI